MINQKDQNERQNIGGKPVIRKKDQAEGGAAFLTSESWGGERY